MKNLNGKLNRNSLAYYYLLFLKQFHFKSDLKFSFKKVFDNYGYM